MVNNLKEHLAKWEVDSGYIINTNSSGLSKGKGYISGRDIVFNSHLKDIYVNCSSFSNVNVGGFLNKASRDFSLSDWKKRILNSISNSKGISGKNGSDYLVYPFKKRTLYGLSMHPKSKGADYLMSGL